MSGHVSYRCYAGYDGRKVVDERTKRPCNNETYKSVLIDKNITIDIVDEPDPEDSPDLAGGWSDHFEFVGRKFTIAISLFKNSSTKPYRARILAIDDQPSPRETAIFSEMKEFADMNTISADHVSVGKKEEIRFWVTVEPASKL